MKGMYQNEVFFSLQIYLFHIINLQTNCTVFITYCCRKSKIVMQTDHAPRVVSIEKQLEEIRARHPVTKNEHESIEDNSDGNSMLNIHINKIISTVQSTGY